MGAGHAAHDLGEGGLARARWAPEDQGANRVRFEGPAERLAGADGFVLAQDLVEGPRANAFGQRSVGPDPVIPFRLGGWAEEVASSIGRTAAHRGSFCCWRAASKSRMPAATPTFKLSTGGRSGMVTRMSAWVSNPAGRPAPSLPKTSAVGGSRRTLV